MKNKAWNLVALIVFGLTFFSSIRIMAIYYYHLQVAKRNQTLAMTMMDKAHNIDLYSWTTGGLQWSVAIVMIMIILDR